MAAFDTDAFDTDAFSSDAFDFGDDVEEESDEVVTPVLLDEPQEVFRHFAWGT